MIEYYKKVVFENFANFDGRARRSEYWYFLLANILVYFAIMIFGTILTAVTKSAAIGIITLCLYILYAVLTIIPSIAVVVRRLHDTGKSGWFYLLAFVPLANIWLIVLLFTEGDAGPNEFGPDPKNPYEDVGEIGKEVF